MGFWDKASAQWKNFCQSMKDLTAKQNNTNEPLSRRILHFWRRLEKLKKVFLAVPVAALSLIMAMTNLFKLPALVGFDLQADGSYTFQIVREVAVVAPLLITGVCLMLMFASKRTLTPWLVSMLSLLVPLTILITNTFPG